MRVALRLDAGGSIGSGHRVRTEALARGARGNYGRALPASSLAGEVDSRFETVAIPRERPARAGGGLPAHGRPGSGPAARGPVPPDAGQLDGLTRGPWRVVHIDDESPLRFEGDLLVNPNLNDCLSPRPRFPHRVPAGRRVPAAARAIREPARPRHAPEVSRAADLPRRGRCLGGRRAGGGLPVRVSLRRDSSGSRSWSVPSRVWIGCGGCCPTTRSGRQSEA